MDEAGKSSWQLSYEKSLRDERSRVEDESQNDSKWQLLDMLPSTGTPLDVLLLPIAVGIVGVAVFRRVRGRD